MKQSVTWWPLSRIPGNVDDQLRIVKDLGFEGVEFAPQEHWQRVRDHGLTVATLGAHGTLTDGLNRRENHGRIAGEIEANLETARRWNVPCLICFSGNRNGLSDDDGMRITAEGLRRVAPLAEAAGVTLVMELLNSKVDHADYQADHTDWGVRVCEAVASPAVKLLYDIYHMQVMEGDLIRTIRTHGAHFGHYHTAGNPGRHELSDDQEIHYPAIARAIRETGFTGFVGHEYGPTRDAIDGLREAHARFVIDG
jgi:hydroxypyruvate isomerase